jgi:hypothetical protein
MSNSQFCILCSVIFQASVAREGVRSVVAGLWLALAIAFEVLT